MREIRLYGSEGGEIEANRSSLPLSTDNPGTYFPAGLYRSCDTKAASVQLRS